MTAADIYRLECLIDTLVTRLGWTIDDCDRWAPIAARIAMEFLDK